MEPTPEELKRMAAALGRRGGKKGGPARARKLTKAQRSAIARKGAAATNLLRWGYRAGRTSSITQRRHAR